MGEWRYSFHSVLTSAPDGGVVRFTSKSLYSRGKGLQIPTEQGEVWAKELVWPFSVNQTKAVIIANNNFRFSSCTITVNHFY